MQAQGLGFAMAHEFLQAGDSIVLCGRNPERLAAALQHLQQHSALRPGQVQGLQCDVSDAADVLRLTTFVERRWAGWAAAACIRWINNAGQVTRRLLLPELSPADIQAVVGANVLGSLLCCRAAVQLMRQQHKRNQQQQQQQGAQYHIFNCGFSRWGASLSKSACTHKATKMALTQLNISLAEELAEAGLSYIGVHNLSPGMVLTDLLLRDANPVARRFFNTLAEEPETVAAAIVPQIRGVKGTGSSIDYLNPASALARVLGGLPQIIYGGRFFDKEGNRVAGLRITGRRRRPLAAAASAAAARWQHQ
ncbi:NAD(P)-binding protein [Scenedesmus sp. NREL 46B-D3]|nr:NAD(P)-binding protein [Scenedesmus sp. NREL 46B-D3]